MDDLLCMGFIYTPAGIDALRPGRVDLGPILVEE